MHKQQISNNTPNQCSSHRNRITGLFTNCFWKLFPIL